MFLSTTNLLSKSQFSIRSTIRVSNSLDSDQARQFVGPELDPNYLHTLSVDDAPCQVGKELTSQEVTDYVKSHARHLLVH